MKRIAACCLLLSLLTVPALAAEEAPAYAASPWAQTEVEEAAALGLDRWTGVGDTSSGILWGDLRQSISRERRCLLHLRVPVVEAAAQLQLCGLDLCGLRGHTADPGGHGGRSGGHLLQARAPDTERGGMIRALRVHL